MKTINSKNKSLKEEMKCFKNELSELKNWKNEKENEFKKLIKEKKDKPILDNIDSIILTKIEELEYIKNACKNNDQLLINRNFKPKLLYRATKDGNYSSVFHKKCDNIRDTLTLVKTNNGFIFGGYTNKIWGGSGGYKLDDKAFCFSIDLQKIYKNKKIKFKHLL